MPIILDNIDLQLNAKLYHKLLQSIEAGAIRKANQKNSKTWVFQVKYKDELVDCELDITSKSIQSHRCACGKSKKNNPCPHVWTATLWYVQQKNKNAKSEQKEISSLNTQEMLLNIEENTLRVFTSYALKSNPTLNHQFQLRFYYLQINPNLSQKYEHVLDKFDADSNLSATQKIKHHKVQLQSLDLFYESMVDLFTKSEFLEMYYGSCIGITKSITWSLHFGNPEKFRRYTLKFHQLIYEAIRSLIEPETREKIFLHLLATIASPNYFFIHHADNLAKYTFDIWHSSKYRKLLLDSSLQKLTNLEQGSEHSNFVLHFITSNYESEQFIAAFDKSKISISNAVLLYYANHCVDRRNYIPIHTLLKFVIQKSMFKNIPLIDKYLELCILLDDQEEIKECCKISFLNNYDIKYLKILFHDAEPDNLIRDDVYTSLKAKDAPSEIKLQMLYLSNWQEELENEIILSENLATVMQFDSQLIKLNSLPVYNYYVQKAVHFMNNHAGKAAFEYVENIKMHFRKYGNKKFEVNFTEDIKKHFPERTTLFQSQSI